MDGLLSGDSTDGERVTGPWSDCTHSSVIGISLQAVARLFSSAFSDSFLDFSSPSILPTEGVSLSLCGAVAVVLANVTHSVYKAAFPDYDRWEFQQCTVTGSKYAVAVVVSALIRMVSEVGRTVGMLGRGEILYIGRRFDWFAGGGGRDPIVNERIGSLQRFVLFITFTMCLRFLQLTAGRAFFSSLDS
jgi:hypothetical protein